MAEEIKIPVIMDTSTIPGSINSLNASIQKLNSNIESGFRKTSSAVKKTTDDSKKGLKGLSDEVSKLPLKFFTLEKAIQLVVKSFQFMTDGVKEFEKQAGLGAQGGLTRLQKSFGQIQIEMGSVLEPMIQKLSKFFEDNIDQITYWARILANVIGNAGSIFVQLGRIVSNTFTQMVATVGFAVSAIANTILTTINDLVQKLPDVIVPKGWKESLQNATDNVKLFDKTMQQTILDAGSDTGQAFKEIGKNFQDMFVIKGPSGIKKRTEKADADAAQKEREQQIKDAEEKNNNLVRKFADAIREAIKRNNQQKIDEQEAVYKYEFDRQKEAFDLNYQATQQYYDNIIAFRRKKGQEVGQLEIDQTIETSKIIAGLQTASKTPSTLVTRKKQTAKTELGFSPDYSNVIEFKKQANETLDYQVNVYNQMAIAGLDYNDQRIKLEKMYADYETETKRLSVEATFNEVATKTELYANMAQQIISISTMVSQAQLENIQRQKESDLAALNETFNMRVKNVKHTGQLEKERQAAQDKINKDALEKEREIKNKQKGWSIASAIINGAVAVTRGFADYGPIVGAVMAVLTAATTAVQVGLIASQKFATGGIVGGTGNKDTVPAMLTPGEMVVNKQQQTHLWNILSGRTPTPAPTVTMGGDTFYITGNLDQNAANQIKDAKEKRLQQLRQDYIELQYRGQLKAA